MIYGSVCSGIEAASVAWHPLGWRAAFLSEIEPFPRAVLAHHYTDVPLHGDFITIQAGEYEPIDLLVGGTPCQSFSVVGLRGGLADERGNLALQFLALAGRLRPRWIVWENVPGVLSSGGGRDFGSFLGGLVVLGYGFAYRVLDAQFFGLAQRRKRVFVVGCLGDWRLAWAVLSQPACLQRHSPPRREAGEGVAACIGAGIGNGGTGDKLNPGALQLAPPITSNPYGDHESREGLLVAIPLKEPDGVAVAWALGSHAGAADGDQTNRSHDSGGPVGSGISEELSHSLRGGRTQAIAHVLRADGFDATDGGMHVSTRAVVRRLTPTECCRLMGFSDTYLDITFRGRPAADGNKYRALGNSFAVPVVRWIGERIAAQEAEMRAAQAVAAAA